MMDEKILAARSRSCRLCAAEFLDRMRPVVRFELRFRDIWEPGALKGAQLALPCEPVPEGDPDGYDGEDSERRCGFHNRIMSAWAYNPCAVSIDPALLEAVDLAGADPSAFHRLVGCPVFLPFERPRPWSDMDDVEGLLIGVVSCTDGRPFVLSLPIASKFRGQPAGAPVPMPASSEEWPAYLDGTDPRGDDAFLLRALVFLSSDRPQVAAWRASTIARADKLKNEKRLFADRDRPVVGTCFTPETVDVGRTVELPQSDARLVRRCDVRGPEDLIPVTDKDIEGWRLAMHNISASILRYEVFPYMFGMRVSCDNIADAVSEESQRHPGLLTAGTLIRLANAAVSLSRVTRLVVKYRGEAASPQAKLMSEKLTITVNRVREVLAQRFPETAQAVNDFRGNACTMSACYVYGTLWHLRNNARAVEAAPAEVKIAPETSAKLFLSTHRLLMKLAEVGTPVARNLYAELIHDFSMLGALSTAKGSISFLLAWKLYKVLLAVGKLLPTEAVLADRIRLTIGKGLLAAGRKDETGEVTPEDANEVFRQATGSKTMGDALLQDYRDDLERLDEDPLVRIDSLSFPWYLPGF